MASLQDEFSVEHKKQFRSAIGRLGGAAGMARASVQVEKSIPVRWQGEVVLKRWEMPELCQDISTPQCGLKSLDLSGNTLTPQDVSLLADALAKNRSIQRLNLWGCGVDDDGAEKLAKAFTRQQVDTYLTHLGLWGNNIGDMGVIKLAQWFQKDYKLQTLDLGQNHIGGQGAHAVAHALAGSGVQEIDLRYNDLSADSIVELAQTFGQSKLAKIDLRYHRVMLTAKDREAIVAAVGRHPKRQFLYNPFV
eukprot:m.54589 g.54589  ORF g.54589 m.54589 type:complete len:249 (-) comp13635_c0_seq1:2097-2843(-)